MTRRDRILLLFAGLTLAAAGCDETASANAGALPPLALVPRLPHFQELAQTAPKPPAPEDLARSMALLEPAFVDLGDQRLQAKSREALLADPIVGAVLEAGLEHENAVVRAAAAFELSKMDRPAALVPLLKRMKYELDKTVRVWLADALVRRGCGSGVDEILSAIRVPATADLAGQRAAEVLRAAGRPVADPVTWEALEKGLRRLQGHWRMVGRLRADAPVVDEATRGRLAELMCALEGFQLRPVDDARFMLAQAGAISLPFLQEAVTANEHYLRAHTLEVLRDLGRIAGELAPAVLPLLADPLTRVDAANALAGMRVPSAVPHLLSWLASPDSELRTAAAQGLGRIRDARALPALRAHMDDTHETMDVRVTAAFAVALFEVDRPAYRFLTDLRDRGAYHEDRLSELIDEVDRAR